jgi:DNA (cytosine-5)-methyltransferase 1
MDLIELFSGGGGFSLGAHQTGFEVKAAFDLDPILSSSYSKNFPDTIFRRRDVAELTGSEIRDLVGGDIDGVIGGPPCQGFSAIGKRDPQDARRSLLGHYFRIVSELRPRFFVMENVQGLGYSDTRHVLDAAIDMVRSDYHIFGPHPCDAADFGAATKRPRLVVIGTRKADTSMMEAADIAAHRKPASTIADAIGDLSEVREIEVDDNGFDVWKITKRGRPSTYAQSMRSADGRFTGHRKTEHTDAVKERFAAVPQGAFDKVGRHPRLAWSGQCPTLRAGTGSDKGSFQSVRPIHPALPRVITVREAARIQGFPDNHLFHPTIWHSFRMIGNSVSPIMARAVLSAVKDRLAFTADGYAIAAE